MLFSFLAKEIEKNKQKQIMSEQKKKKLRREEFLECLGVNENKVNKGKK